VQARMGGGVPRRRDPHPVCGDGRSRALHDHSYVSLAGSRSDGRCSDGICRAPPAPSRADFRPAEALRRRETLDVDRTTEDPAPSPAKAPCRHVWTQHTPTQARCDVCAFTVPTVAPVEDTPAAPRGSAP
jgi:hypothetical protein